MSTTTPNLGLHKYTVSEVGDTVGDMVTGINADADTLDGLLGLVYPVGSIYMSVNSTSPATLFGGTWEALGDKFLIGAGTNHAAGATGGSETKTISTANLPSHTHGLNSHKHTIGAHSHGLNSHKHSIGAHKHGLGSHVHSYDKPVSHFHEIGLSYRAVRATGMDGIMVASALNDIKMDTYNAEGAVATITGAAGGNTDNSSAFDSGAASGSTANSTAFDSGAATGNTAATGSGDALNIMPPFLSVYMWKRTA